MTALTVSQSLRRVKKLKGRMAELTARAHGVVSYEAGKKPNFEFKALRVEIAKVREDLVTLEAAVAKANAVTVISVDESRMTIAEAIRRLQELKAEMSWVSSLQIREGVERHADMEWDDQTDRPVRRTREVTHISDLKETEKVAEIDELRDRFERLNDAVERANHVTTVEWKEPSAPPSAA
jgi:hypothetical protein